MRASLFVTAATAALPSATAQKTPDVRVDRHPSSVFAVSTLSPIVAVGDAIYVVWQDPRNGPSDIYFNRSLDAGATWMPQDVRLNTSAPGATDSLRPRLAASGDAVYVVWYEARNQWADIWFNRSLDRGATWLAQDVRLNTNRANSSTSDTPEIAAVGTDVFVVWADQRNVWAGVAGPNLYLNRSLDQGSTWLAQDIPVDAHSNGGSTEQSIQATAAGVFVTWRFNGIWFNRSLDRGTTWLPQEKTISPDGRYPKLYASNSALHVIREWFDDLIVTSSVDLGSSWSPSITLTTVGSPSFDAATSGSAIYVAYTAFPDIHFTRSLDNGATWSSPIEIDRGEVSFVPSIAANGPDVHVAYQDSRGNPAIYYTRSHDSGTTWLEQDIRLNQSTHRALTPQVALAGDTPAVAWYDSREHGSIWFNIPYGFQPYGAGTPGTGNIVPRLTGSGTAVPGSSVQLDLVDALGGAAGVWLLGGPGARQSIEVLGGTLLVMPSLGVPLQLGGLGAGSGTATLALPIPAVPAITGLDLQFQAWLLDPGTPGQVSMSQGLEMWIGPS